MDKIPSTPASSFHTLCKVLGGQNQAALKECISAGLIQPLFDAAKKEDLLPALAVRCNELEAGSGALGQELADELQHALLDNTLRNMQISAQALKLTRQLNRAGIVPLFLKGTARLLISSPEFLGFRKQVDIDLIVEPAEIKAAGDAFLADGYSYSVSSGNSSSAQTTLRDTAEAMKLSAPHHHLPPLVKAGYVATVELHRHFLDRRFQRANPLEALFRTAPQIESHGATFKVPSTEFQIINIVLGKFVNDGHMTRRTFPIREGCDLIELLEGAQGEVNEQLVLQHCGCCYPLFQALVCELMNYRPRTGIAEFEGATKYTRLMQRRFESHVIRQVLDARARTEQLANALVYSPAKLPAYLRRLFSSSQS